MPSARGLRGASDASAPAAGAQRRSECRACADARPVVGRRAALRGLATIPAQRQFNFSNRGFRWRGSTTPAGLGSVPGAQVQMAAEEAMQEQSDPSVTIERVSLSFYFFFWKGSRGPFSRSHSFTKKYFGFCLKSFGGAGFVAMAQEELAFLGKQDGEKPAIRSRMNGKKLTSVLSRRMNKKTKVRVLGAGIL